MKSQIHKKRIYLEKGQSLVEMALTLTIVLTLIAGAFDFGFAFFRYVELRDAAQEGAIFGSVFPGDEAAIINRIRTSSTLSTILLNSLDFVNPLESDITITGAACTGSEITVRLVHHYQLTMPFIGAIIGSQTIPLTAQVTNTILLPECD